MKNIILTITLLFALLLPAIAFSSGGVSPPKPVQWKKSEASFYGKGSFTGYCGKKFVSERHFVVAHKTLPCNKTVFFKHKKKIFKAKVVDRGPYHGNREFDLSYALAKKLKLLNKGVGKVSWRR